MCCIYFFDINKFLLFMRSYVNARDILSLRFVIDGQKLNGKLELLVDMSL